MEATAKIHFDRDYFEAHYDDWLANRSRWRPYAMPVALAALVAGAALLRYTPAPAIGVTCICMGLYSLFEALTHRRRWLKKRLEGLPPDKVVTIQFRSESMDTETPNSSGTLQYDGISEVVGTPTGIFILVQTGVSMYIPRASIEPAGAFIRLLEHLEKAINRRS